MADDSKIQVIDFLNEVESNRRSLIANAQSKGKVISSGASLTQAVAVNNTISPSASPEKIEVRFFDADGTLLQQSFIEYGGSVTPPANPNYDPQRLTFKRWASAIGERFDNITHDVDYGALYTINNGGFYLFLTIDDNSGYTVTLSPYQNVAHTITIDWGDGTPNDTKTNTGTTQISHTYAQEGDYEIVVTRDYGFEFSGDYWYLGSYIVSTSTSNSSINALDKIYAKCLPYLSLNLSNVNIDVLIMENFINSSSGTITGIRNIVLANSLYDNISTYQLSINCYNSNTLILDESMKMRFSASNFYGKLDKIMFPHTASFVEYTNTLKKVIYLDALYPNSNSNSLMGTKSLQFLSDNFTKIGNISSAPNLEEYIFPNSVKSFDNYIAPNSLLETFVLPENCIIVNNAFYQMYNLKNIVLYKDFDISFNIYSYDFSTESFIDMLYKVKDNSGLEAKTLNISQTRLQNKMLKTYVVLNNGRWELATIDTPNAITLVEAFNSKNWTIA